MISPSFPSPQPLVYSQRNGGRLPVAIRAAIPWTQGCLLCIWKETTTTTTTTTDEFWGKDHHSSGREGWKQREAIGQRSDAPSLEFLVLQLSKAGALEFRGAEVPRPLASVPRALAAPGSGAAVGSRREKAAAGLGSPLEQAERATQGGRLS